MPYPRAENDDTVTAFNPESYNSAPENIADSKIKILDNLAKAHGICA
jgi:hypothetical protein